MYILQVRDAQVTYTSCTMASPWQTSLDVYLCGSLDELPERARILPSPEKLTTSMVTLEGASKMVSCNWSASQLRILRTREGR